MPFCFWSIFIKLATSETGYTMPEKSIEQVQKEYSNKWMSIPGVEGTAVGLENNKSCILVFSSIETELLHKKLPKEIEGYPVIIKCTGTFEAFEED